MKNNTEIAYEFIASCERTVSKIMRRDVKLIMNIEYHDAITIPIKIDMVVKIVADELDLIIEVLRSNTRSRPYVNARSIICRICRDNIKSTLVEIAEGIGKKDHATVINALNNSHDWEETDREYRNILRRCQEAYKQTQTPKTICT